MKDLEYIFSATKIDLETVKSVASALAARIFLAIGQVTADYPFIIETKALPYKTAGKTRSLCMR